MMNDRIQELAYLAEDYADSIVDQGGEFHETYTKKLAELIVKECAQFVDREIGEGGVDGQMLKEHFGVENLPGCKHDWYSAKNRVVQNGSVCVICDAIDAREPEELKNEPSICGILR